MKSLLFVLALLFVLPAHADSVLRITCEEQDLGAEISINGEFKGECPLDLKVKPGELEIRLKKPINEDYEKAFLKKMRIGDSVVQKIEAKLHVSGTLARGVRIMKEIKASYARHDERVSGLAPVLADYQQNDIKPGNGKTFKDCDTCPEMLLIPSTRGVWIGDGSNHYVHIVAFALARTEVTQAQWQALMGNNPSRSKACGGDCPVENVSWYDAQAYVKKLAEVTGKPYRLPSESEWEYACGGGKDDKYCGGNDLHTVAVASDRYGERQSQKVGQKAPNAWGLFDMSGNVSEWVEDCFHHGYLVNNGAPDDGSAWTSYPRDLNPNARASSYSCDNRVIRGGDASGVFAKTSLERTNRQTTTKPENRFHHGGFRVAMTLDMTEQDMPRYVERECKRKVDALADFHAKSRLGEVVSVDRNAQRLELKLDAPAAKDGNLYGYVLTKEHTRLYPKLNVTAGATNIVLAEKSLDNVSVGDVYYPTRYTRGCQGSTAYCALVKQTCPN